MKQENSENSLPHISFWFHRPEFISNSREKWKTHSSGYNTNMNIKPTPVCSGVWLQSATGQHEDDPPVKHTQGIAHNIGIHKSKYLDCDRSS